MDIQRSTGSQSPSGIDKYKRAMAMLLSGVSYDVASSVTNTDIDRLITMFNEKDKIPSTCDQFLDRI